LLERWPLMDVSQKDGIKSIPGVLKSFRMLENALAYTPPDGVPLGPEPTEALRQLPLEAQRVAVMAAAGVLLKLMMMQVSMAGLRSAMVLQRFCKRCACYVLVACAPLAPHLPIRSPPTA
jgi:hypothetical protein